MAASCSVPAADGKAPPSRPSAIDQIESCNTSALAALAAATGRARLSIVGERARHLARWSAPSRRAGARSATARRCRAPSRGAAAVEQRRAPGSTSMLDHQRVLASRAPERLERRGRRCAPSTSASASNLDLARAGVMHVATLRCVAPQLPSSSADTQRRFARVRRSPSPQPSTVSRSSTTSSRRTARAMHELVGAADRRLRPDRRRAASRSRSVITSSAGDSERTRAACGCVGAGASPRPSPSSRIGSGGTVGPSAWLSLRLRGRASSVGAEVAVQLGERLAVDLALEVDHRLERHPVVVPAPGVELRMAARRAA